MGIIPLSIIPVMLQWGYLEVCIERTHAHRRTAHSLCLLHPRLFIQQNLSTAPAHRWRWSLAEVSCRSRRFMLNRIIKDPWELSTYDDITLTSAIPGWCLLPRSRQKVHLYPFLRYYCLRLLDLRKLQGSSTQKTTAKHYSWLKKRLTNQLRMYTDCSTIYVFIWGNCASLEHPGLKPEPGTCARALKEPGSFRLHPSHPENMHPTTTTFFLHSSAFGALEASCFSVDITSTHWHPKLQVRFRFQTWSLYLSAWFRTCKPCWMFAAFNQTLIIFFC